MSTRRPSLVHAAILSVLVFACLGLPGCSRPGASSSTGESFGSGMGADMTASAPIDWKRLEKELSRQETVEGNLKKGNIDLSSSTIEYYGRKAGASDSAGTLAPEKGDLEIVDHGPEGELPIEMRRPTVYVMFNHPIVPLAKLGEPMTESPVMKLEPAVKGVFRWYGTRVLSFEPDAVLVDNPRYVVTVSGDTKSLGGKKLGKDYAFSFFTETVKIVNYYPGKSADTGGYTWEVPTKVAQYAILEFNQPVDPAHIQQFIQIKAGKRDLGFSVSRPEYPDRLDTRTPRAVLISLKAEPPENTEISVVLKDGASPMKGYPERKGEQVQSYRTVSPFTFKSLNANQWDMPRNNKPGALPVYAGFSHEMEAKAASLAWTVKVEGKAVKPAAFDLFGSVLRINIEGLSPGMTVFVTPPPALKDVYGRKLSNPGSSIGVKIPEPYPYVSFPVYSGGFRHLEAAYPPKFVWESRNIDVASFGAKGAAFFDFSRPNSGWPATSVLDISSWKRNQVHYSVEDLKPFLNPSGYGTVYYSWNAEYPSRWVRETERSSGNFSIQVTDIGITTRYAFNRILVWANSLSTGKPIPNAKVSLLNPTGTPVKDVRTDAAGLAVFNLGTGEFFRNFNYGEYWNYRMFIEVEAGADRAQLPVSNSHNSWNDTSYGHGSPVTAEKPVDRIMIFTDRGLYKPGEELALRGIHWLHDPKGFTPYSDDYTLTLNDPRDETLIWKASGKASASGGFAHRFILPSDLEPGTYSIRYTGRPGTYGGGVSFTIAQFRRLAFQVQSSVADRTFTMGDQVSVEVSASYLAGGALPGAGYTYYWTRKPRGFTPPGTSWKGWVFGPGAWEGEHSLGSGKGTLSPSGTVTLKEETDGQNAAGAAYDYVLETTVQDVDRQAIASAASILVHPASFYIGARFASGSTDGWWSRFVSTGQEVKLETALVDPAGALWARDAELKASILLGHWKSSEQQGVYGRVNTRWEYVEEEVQSSDLHVKGGRSSWTFKLKDSGDYILSVEGKDAKGRLSKTSLRFYATGSSWVRRATETPTTIEMLADKEEYLPGETARILVRSPLPSGKYLLTVEREGIAEQKLVDLTDGKSMVELPITEAHVPVVYVALTSFTKREAAPSDYFEPDLGKPRSLFGIVGLRVSTRPVELDVYVQAAESVYKPGAEAEVLVRVSRAGKPVAGGEVTLMAVDRGVLDLIDYHVPDPIEFFYDPYGFPLCVDGDDSRRLLLKPVTYDTSVLTGGAGEKLQERKDFRPLVLFEPFVRTDANGEARVSFTLPDSLTTYRLTAVALNGARLGLQEGELLVQNPVNVRTALPRKFRNRDTAAAGVVLTNLTSVAQKVDVTAESDILSVAGSATRSVEIPPKGVYELPFVLSATRPGEGKISFIVRSDVVNEKLTEPVTVERPLVKEAFSTVGVIARGESAAQEGIVLPEAISPGYGSLTVKASSSLRPYIEPALANLLDTTYWEIRSFYYKLTYSFAAIWQQTNNPLVQGLLSELKTRQLPGGGIYTGSWIWKPYLPDPYISLLTAHLMDFAESRNRALSGGPDRAKLLSYLSGLKEDKDLDPYFKAYLAYVLAASGRKDSAFLGKVEGFEDSLGLGGYGLLAQAYLEAGDKTSADRVYRRSKNFVLMGTQKVDVKDTYEVTNYWTSLVAEMALMLKNSVALGEDTGFIQRLAGSLNRSERYWQTRNDDLWTLLGFVPLLDAEGPASGGATLTVKSGGTPLVNASLSAKQPEAQAVLELGDKPLSALPRDKMLPLDFAKTGDTPLYYTTILRYALPNETALARDEGIEVNLRYETLDGDSVKEDALVLGETYRVRINLSTTKRRQRLELLVPVPNGVEIVDPTFVTTGRFVDQGGTDSETITRETVYGDEIDVIAEGYAGWGEEGWYWYFYNPDSFALDNMMVYRWTDFYAGRREVTFLVRVTTPGIYPTPPASASLEFEPEVFGRSEGKLFVIKP